jgi:hypothetical protein
MNSIDNNSCEDYETIKVPNIVFYHTFITYEKHNCCYVKQV